MDLSRISSLKNNNCVEYSQRNCCRHAGFHCVAFIGRFDREAGFAGENRSGGDCANGTPRNWLTGARPLGSEVDFPINMPVSMIAIGPSYVVACPKPANELATTMQCCRKCIIEDAETLMAALVRTLSIYQPRLQATSSFCSSVCGVMKLGIFSLSGLSPVGISALYSFSTADMVKILGPHSSPQYGNRRGVMGGLGAAGVPRLILVAPRQLVSSYSVLEDSLAIGLQDCWMWGGSRKY